MLGVDSSNWNLIRGYDAIAGLTGCGEQVLTFVYKNLHFFLDFGGAFALITAGVARLYIWY